MNGYLQFFGILATVVLGGGGFVGLIKLLLDNSQTKHKAWFDESQDLYDTVSKQCKECQDTLRAQKDTHVKEVQALRAELADVKIALIGRTDIIDEMLEYIRDFPDDKIMELRANNRAARLAVLKSHAYPSLS